MKYVVGLVLVGCGVGIVGIQSFGDPAGWATTIPGDLPRLGLAAISVLALIVGGMVFTTGGSAPLPPPVEEPTLAPKTKKAKREAISEPLDVLSLDEDEEAARRRARRAAKRRKAKQLAESGSGEVTRKRKKSRSDDASRTRKRARSSKEGTRRRSKSSGEVVRKRKREHATSGRI